MKRTFRWLMAAGLALPAFAAPIAPAHAQEPQVTVLYDGSVLTVGDRAAVTVQVQHPADTTAIFPELGHGWGEFEVLAQHPVEVSENADGTLTSRRTLELVLFAPGEAATPAMDVVISDRAGLLTTVSAAPVSVRVDSVLTPADTELRDLKAQATLPGGIPDAGRLFGGLAALALAIAGFLWLWRRRQGGFWAGTPLERALGELGVISAAGLPAQGKYKQLYLAVTQTVRRHVEQEFGVRLQDRTTSELRSTLRQVALPAETSKRMLQLCMESDLVKFAQVTPTPASAAALFEEARAVVISVSQARDSAAHPPLTPQPATRAGTGVS